MDLKIMAGQLYNQYMGKEAKIKYINGEDQELIGKKGVLCTPYASSFGAKIGLRSKDLDVINLLDGDIVELLQAGTYPQPQPQPQRQPQPQKKAQATKDDINEEKRIVKKYAPEVKEKSLSQAKRDVVQDYKDKYEAIKKHFIGKYFINEGFICLAKEYVEKGKSKFIDVFMYDSNGKMIERHNVIIDNFYIDTPVYRYIENTPLFKSKKITPVVKNIKDPNEEKIKKLYDKGDKKRRQEKAVKTPQYLYNKNGEISFTFTPSMFNLVKKVKGKRNLYAVLFDLKNKKAVCTDAHKLQILNLNVKGDISELKDGKILLSYEYKKYFKNINVLSKIDYKDNTCYINGVKIPIVEENYPNYQQVLPKKEEAEKTFTIEDKRFYMEGVEKLKEKIYEDIKQKFYKDHETPKEDYNNACVIDLIETEQKNADIHFYLYDNKLEAYQNDSKAKFETYPVKWPITSRIDLNLYIDIIANTKDLEYTIYYKSDLTPILMTSENTNNVIMPIRL